MQIKHITENEAQYCCTSQFQTKMSKSFQNTFLSNNLHCKFQADIAC